MDRSTAIYSKQIITIMLDYVKHHYNVTLKEANDCIWNRYGLPNGDSSVIW